MKVINPVELPKNGFFVRKGDSKCIDPWNKTTELSSNDSGMLYP